MELFLAPAGPAAEKQGNIVTKLLLVISEKCAILNPGGGWNGL